MAQRDLKKHMLKEVIESGEMIGGGGYASVFLATYRGSNVAIKKLHTIWMGLGKDNRPSKEFVKFLDEFSTLRRLAHPCILQVYGMIPPTVPEGSYGVVMELLQMTLKERYMQSPYLTESEEIGIAVCVCSGIEYLHDEGVFHRDITTSNVMVTGVAPGKRGVLAKIIDAGSARVLNDKTAEVLSLSLKPGAERYMAPETRQGINGRQPKYGRPADVYSFGVMGIAMVRRREPQAAADFPCEGCTADVEDLAREHPISPFLLQCVLDKPSARPSAMALREELVRIQERFATVTTTPAAASSGAAGAAGNGHSDQEDSRTLRLDRDRLAAELAANTEEMERLRAKAERHQQQIASALEEQARLREEIATEHQLAERRLAGAMHQAIQESQMSTTAAAAPSSLAATANIGLMARCRRLFTVDGVLPCLKNAPEWKSRRLAFPSNVTRAYGTPCFHEGRFYYGFRRAGVEDRLSLYCIKAPVCDDDNVSDMWQFVPLPDGDWHSHARLLSHNGSLYTVLCSLSLSDPCRVFCLESSARWHLVASFPCVLSRFGAVITGSKLLVAGGKIGPGATSKLSSSVHILDLCNPDSGWHRWPDLPLACSNPQVVCLNSRAHVLASLESGYDVFSLKEPGDSVSGSEWLCNSMPSVPDVFCRATVMNGYIVLGSGYTQAARSVFMYTPECRQYLPLPSLRNQSDCYLSHDNVLYAISGGHDLDHLELEVLSV